GGVIEAEGDDREPVLHEPVDECSADTVGGTVDHRDASRRHLGHATGSVVGDGSRAVKRSSTLAPSGNEFSVTWRAGPSGPKHSAHATLKAGRSARSATNTRTNTTSSRVTPAASSTRCRFWNVS